jgi:D-alanine transaminase
MSLVYLNGEYLPIEQARISVLDRGFTFADGVYEIIPVFNGKILRPDEHLIRLANSLSSIAINNPCTSKEWRQIFSNLLADRTDDRNYSIYIQVTRGTGERNHIYDNELVPTVLVMCNPVNERDYSHGVTAITHEDIRWKYCHIKAITLLPGVLLKKLAKDTDGSFEAILIREGLVTEGASSNVFMVSEGQIKTPAKDGSILAGITRDLLVNLLQDNVPCCTEQKITEQELRQADEIWITSSTIGVVPVIMLDGMQVGSGKPGEIWKLANSIYESYKREL